MFLINPIGYLKVKTPLENSTHVKDFKNFPNNCVAFDFVEFYEKKMSNKQLHCKFNSYRPEPLQCIKDEII